MFNGFLTYTASMEEKRNILLKLFAIAIVIATIFLSFAQPAKAEIWAVRIRNNTNAPQIWTVYDQPEQQYIWNNTNLVAHQQLTDSAENYNNGDSLSIGVDDSHYTALQLTNNGWQLFPAQPPFTLDFPNPAVVRVNAN